MDLLKRLDMRRHWFLERRTLASLGLWLGEPTIPCLLDHQCVQLFKFYYFTSNEKTHYVSGGHYRLVLSSHSHAYTDFFVVAQVIFVAFQINVRSHVHIMASTVLG